MLSLKLVVVLFPQLIVPKSLSSRRCCTMASRRAAPATPSANASSTSSATSTVYEDENGREITRDEVLAHASAASPDNRGGRHRRARRLGGSERALPRGCCKGRRHAALQ